MVFVNSYRDGPGAVYDNESVNGTNEIISVYEKDSFSTCGSRGVEDTDMRAGEERGSFIPATSPITGGASVLEGYNRTSSTPSSTVKSKLDTRPKNHSSTEGGKMQVSPSPTLSRSSKDNIAQLDLRRGIAETSCMGAPLALPPFSDLLPADAGSFETGGLADDHPFSVKQQFRMSTEFAPLWRSYCRDDSGEMADGFAGEEEKVGLRDGKDGLVGGLLGGLAVGEGEAGDEGDELLLVGDGEVRLGKGERDGGSNTRFCGCFCWSSWIGVLGRVLEDWG